LIALKEDPVSAQAFRYVTEPDLATLRLLKNCQKMAKF